MKGESDEWLEELVRSWTEVYKKSVTTLELMRAIAELESAPANAIGERFTQQTGWGLTERSLYRTLRRLASAGLLRVDEIAVERTGAKRKDYSITALGSAYLAQIEKVAGRSS